MNHRVGLDPGARRDLWLYLQTLREKEGVTILVTTHLVDEGDRSDHVLVLNLGQVVAFGTPDSLKQEIGGDVIAITTRDAGKLSAAIRDKFAITTGHPQWNASRGKTAGAHLHQPGRGCVSGSDRFGQPIQTNP